MMRPSAYGMALPLRGTILQRGGSGNEGSQRKKDLERRAALRGDEPDRAAVRVDERAGDGETEPGAAVVAGGREERVEDLRRVGIRDAGAVVGDAQAGVRSLRADVDRPARAAVLARVVEEAREHGLERLGIGRGGAGSGAFDLDRETR